MAVAVPPMLEHISYINSAINQPIELIETITDRRGAQTARVSVAGEPMLLKVGVTNEQRVMAAHPQITGNRLKHYGDNWMLCRWLEPVSLKKAEQSQLECFIEMAELVARLHQQSILHGDLQPAHFMREQSGELHLLDWQLAHKPSDEYGGAFVHFSAPETCASQLAGRPVFYDFLAEQYSLATCFFTLYTKQVPADYGEYQNNLKSMPLEFSRARIRDGHKLSFAKVGAKPFVELESVLVKALSLRPSERFKSVDEMAQALASIN